MTDFKIDQTITVLKNISTNSRGVCIFFNFFFILLIFLRVPQSNYHLRAATFSAHDATAAGATLVVSPRSCLNIPSTRFNDVSSRQNNELFYKQEMRARCNPIHSNAIIHTLQLFPQR